MQNRQTQIAPRATRTWSRAFEQLVTRLVDTSGGVTSSAPHLRSRTSVERLLLYFVLASTPALLVGLWNLGAQTFQIMLQNEVTTLPEWQWTVFASLGIDLPDHGLIGPLLLGAIYFLPLLIVVLATGIFWELLFATVRRRPVDPGWLMACWLYALLLPGLMPPLPALLGMSFGLVFGKHIFGGTGRYIVSPALLGLLFLQFSYPGYFVGGEYFLAAAGSITTTTWNSIVTGGLAQAAVSGLSFGQVFLGREIGSVGAGSALLCLAGAAALVYKGASSARTILGALTGLICTSSIVNVLATEPAAWHLPWYWHIALGTFAFGVAFIATDPTPSPMTAAGRWIQGGLIGVLTILIRTFNPAHPDGTLYAILLVTLATPVIDHFVIRFSIVRRQRRWSRGS